jgi:hypothetical protein
VRSAAELANCKLANIWKIEEKKPNLYDAFACCSTSFFCMTGSLASNQRITAATNSDLPEFELRLCPWLILFKY